VNIAALLLKAYPSRTIKKLKLIGKICGDLSSQAYLVGGPVRDLLSGMKNIDIDIAVEHKNPSEVVNRLSPVLKASPDTKHSVKYHGQFGTATVYFKEGSLSRHIDFAMTRCEIYDKGGILPQVEPSDIKKDLNRRDFTVNSIAVCLNPLKFGLVVDPYGGVNDLKHRVLRILHNRSFYEDPTRIFRAARFITRFNLKPEKKTAILLKNAIESGYIPSVSRERIRKEFIAVLNESDTAKCIKLLSDWGVLKYVDPKISLVSVDKVTAGQLNHTLAKKAPLPIKLCILLYRQHDERLIKSILRNIKLNRSVVNEICSVFKHMSGEKTAGLPSWTKYFFHIIKFKKRKIILDGDDLVGLGFTPGPIFKKILKELSRHSELNTRKKAVDFVKKKYEVGKKCRLL
jgi:tRNA nucleotidyltransferase (CCA-adding enzyme)